MVAVALGAAVMAASVVSVAGGHGRLQVCGRWWRGDGWRDLHDAGLSSRSRNSTLTANEAIAGADDVPVTPKRWAARCSTSTAPSAATDSTFALNTAADDGASIFNLVLRRPTARVAQTTLIDTIVAMDSRGRPDVVSDKPLDVSGAANNSGGVAEVNDGELRPRVEHDVA